MSHMIYRRAEYMGQERGVVVSEPQQMTWERASSVITSNLINGLHVTAGWVDAQEGDGGSVVIIWGREYEDGSRSVLSWYEHEQPVSGYSLGNDGHGPAADC